jgi:L-iditol 2-dehydrogenase
VLGVACDEFRQDGAFAEYVAVPQRILYRLPDSLSFERAAMVEPVSVAVHAVGRLPVRLADTAVVVGAGMIGLFVVQALRLAGCGRIIAVDLDRAKLKLACRLGADEGLSPQECDVPAELRRQTSDRGVDLAVEVVGLPPTVAMAIASLRKGGSLSLVGNLAPNVELPLQTIVARELNLFGSYASSGEYPACLELIARGAIDIDAMLSAVVPLAEAPAWFHRLHRGGERLMKVILTP